MAQERKRRFSSEEARQELLLAGRELVRDRGLEAGLSRVTFGDAIVRSGVPRGSAYRLWANHRFEPQDAFRADLMADLIERGTVAESEPTEVAIFDAAKRELALIDASDPVELAFALRQIVRVGCEVNVKSIAASSEWGVYLASFAAIAFESAPDAAIIAAHERGETYATAQYVELYQTLARTFGLRLRSGMSWEQFSSLAAAAAQGAALRWRFNVSSRRIPRPTGRDGANQDWTAFGVLFEGLLLATATADRDGSTTVSADLSSWLT